MNLGLPFLCGGGGHKILVYSGNQISGNFYPLQTEHVLDIKLGAEPWSALTFVCVCGVGGGDKKIQFSVGISSVFHRI